MKSLKFDSPPEGFDSYQLKRLSVSRLFVFLLFGCLSLGILFLLSYWFERIFYLIYVDEERISHAGYILLVSSRGDIQVEPLRRSKCKINPYTPEKHHLYFSLNGLLFYYSFKHSMFKSVKHKLKKFIESYKESKFTGIQTSDVPLIRRFYGANMIKIKFLHIALVFISLIFFPPNFFQVLIAAGLFSLNRIFYGINLCIYILFSAGLSTYEKLSIRKNLKSKIIQDVRVKVFRVVNQQSVEDLIDATDLVPGDLVSIESNMKIPCDLVIVEGSSLVNEAMFTGESAPISKSEIVRGKRIDSKNVLFSGTVAIFNRTPLVKAVVIGTNWNTAKGEMLSGVVHTKERVLKFQQHFFILLAILFTFNVLMIALVTISELTKEIPSYRNIGLKVLDFARYGFPPSLYFITMTAIQISISSLGKSDIKVFSSFKLVEAGAVKVVCFDKTGTLTENRLTTHGFLVSDHRTFEAVTTDIERFMTLSVFDVFLEGISCCHSLNVINGNVTGDPLEEELFSFSKSSMELKLIDSKPVNEISLNYDYTAINNVSREANQIILVDEFTSEKRRMGVVVRKSESKTHRFFLKGAPEIIKDMLRQETIPENFQSVLNEFSQEGLRVLALAYKDISNDEMESLKDDDTSALEKDLTFIGLLLFKNPIKESTRPVIRQLRNCLYDTAIITGDNIFTAISVAYGTEMIDKNQKLLVATQNKNEKISWQEFDPANINDQFLKKQYEVHSIASSVKLATSALRKVETSFANVLRQCKEEGFVLAFEGMAFETCLHQFGSDQIGLLLSYSVVFARTSALQKEIVISEMKNFHNKNFKYVAFVGDGSNDCRALNLADIGLSIANAESAFAAPFFSSKVDIDPILDILIEGKICLNNALQNFKFIMTANHISIFNVFLMNYYGLDITQSDYVLKFLFALPIAFTLSSTKGIRKLNFFLMRPTVLNKDFLIPFFALLYASFGLILIAFKVIINTPIHKHPSEAVSDELYGNVSAVDIHYFVENKLIIFFVHCLYLTAGYNAYFGYPFKTPFFSNLICWLIYGSIVIIVSHNLFPHWLWSGDQLAIVTRIFRTPNPTQEQLFQIVSLLVISVTFLVLLEKILKYYFLTERAKEILNEDKRPKVDLVPVDHISNID